MPEDLFRVLSEDGRLLAGREPQLASDALLAMYRTMVLTRLFDARMIGLHRQGRLGIYASSEGEEAIGVGAASALRKSDWLFPDYRVTAALFVRGVRPREFLAQLFGTREDPAKGRQLPTHYASREHHIASISSPVANGIPHAVGFAWAARIRKGPEAVLTFFGDGATSEEGFHAGMNIAGVHRLPVVFVCRNNQYAISVPLHLQTASKTIAVKAQAYGFDGVRVDGNDVLAVYAAAEQAFARARAGEGPTLIEAVSYRRSAHSTSDDPRMYREEEEVEAWRRRDCLERFRRHLEGRGLWNEEREWSLQAELKGEIQQAIEEAEAVPPPSVDTLFEDVYAEMPRHLREQRDALLAHRRAKGDRA